MRGALKLDAEVVAAVTALGHRLGLTLGAAEVREGNEIAAVEQVLRQLVLTGKVVTVDALHTQMGRTPFTGFLPLLALVAKPTCEHKSRVNCIQSRNSSS